MKTKRHYTKKSSPKLPLGLIVAGVLLAGIIVGVLYIQQQQDVRSRAATADCKMNLYGECEAIPPDSSLSAGLLTPKNAVPRCVSPVSLKITYATDNSTGTGISGCLPKYGCDGYQPVTSVGWNTNLAKPSANYASGAVIPLTTADGTWIADNRNFRSSSLIHGLAVSRVGNGSVVFSHANSMQYEKFYKGEFQAINASMQLTGATIGQFINGDQKWALDRPIGTNGEAGAMVDTQGDGRWSVPPTYMVDQNGKSYITEDEIVYTIGSNHWAHKTRIRWPGDDYVMQLSCPQVPKPVDIMLVADRSSTMNEKEPVDGRTKLAHQLEAMHNFAVTMRKSGDSMGVDSFGAQGDMNDSTYGNLILASEYKSTLNIGLTSNYDSIISAIDNIKYNKSGTCIQCGILIGNRQMTDTSARRVVILLSDGMANHTWTGTTAHINGVTNTQAAINAANAGRAAGIEYKVVGYGSEPNNVDQETLRQIAGCSPDVSSPCANYQYEPNSIGWPDAFQNIAQDILQGK